MKFEVNTNVDLINQPLLMIEGEKANSLYMTKEVYANAKGTQQIELFLNTKYRSYNDILKTA